MIRARLAVVAIAIAAAFPGAAIAAPSQGEPGASPAAKSKAFVPTETAVPISESDSDFPPVPFNGIDALALSAIALSLLAAGLALRRLSSSS